LERSDRELRREKRRDGKPNPRREKENEAEENEENVKEERWWDSAYIEAGSGNVRRAKWGLSEK